MYSETRWLIATRTVASLSRIANLCTMSHSRAALASGVSLLNHNCGYFVWICFLGRNFRGCWGVEGRDVCVKRISSSFGRSRRRACGRSVWQPPTSAPGRASSSCFPPTPAFHRCRTQRCSEPSDRPTHRSLQFFLVIFIFDTLM